MKQLKSIIMAMMAMCLFTACSSDDDENIVDSAWTEVNVLRIQSDNGKASMNPPHCYIEKGIVYNDGNPITVYHMGFGANIKGSDVFDMLNITFESDKPMSFSNMKAGDTFDNNQFHAAAAYTPTWTTYILIQAPALSGKVTVVGTSKIGNKSYMTLRLSDLRFDAIDHSCVYTVNGTVEYEIWDIHYE